MNFKNYLVNFNLNPYKFHIINKLLLQLIYNVKFVMLLFWNYEIIISDSRCSLYIGLQMIKYQRQKIIITIHMYISVEYNYIISSMAFVSLGFKAGLYFSDAGTLQQINMKTYAFENSSFAIHMCVYRQNLTNLNEKTDSNYIIALFVIDLIYLNPILVEVPSLL